MTDPYAPPSAPQVLTPASPAEGSQPTSGPLPPWGYFSTFGWVLLALLASSVVGLVAVVAWKPDAIMTMGDFDAFVKDATAFSISSIVAAPVIVLILVGAARIKRWPIRDYFALNAPNARDTVYALVVLAIFMPGFDLVSWLAGQDVVTPFQKDAYLSAEKAGTLVLLWLAIVVGAPIAEEMTFRGFIYRGWVRSPRSLVPAIIVMSVFFASLHLQYNLYGIVQVFGIGVLLAYFRWRSNSLYLPMLMHALNNLYSMVQTVLALKWMA